MYALESTFKLHSVIAFSIHVEYKVEKKQCFKRHKHLTYAHMYDTRILQGFFCKH